MFIGFPFVEKAAVWSLNLYEWKAQESGIAR